MSEEQLSPMVMSQADSLDSLRQQLHELHPSKQKDAAAEEAKTRKACQDFEAVFIGQLWKQMRDSVPKDGILHSKEEESYVSMFDQEMSVKMARSGGIGLGDMLYSNLKERLQNASKDTSSPKPLLPLDKSGHLPPATAKQSETPTLEAMTAMQQAEMLADSIVERSRSLSVAENKPSGKSLQMQPVLEDGFGGKAKRGS